MYFRTGGMSVYESIAWKIRSTKRKRRIKMNKFIGVGTLPRPATLNGSQTKVLRFTLATHLGINTKTQKERWAFVPCVIFKPSESTVEMLTEHPMGVLLGMEGRVNTSRFESKGQTRYSTEVIVEERSVHILEVHVGAESMAGTGK